MDQKPFYIKDNEGNVYKGDKSSFGEDLISQGFSEATDQDIANNKAKQFAEENPITASGLAAGAGVLRSASFGASDPIIAATGIASKEDIEALKTENPLSTLGGEVGGFLLPTGLESLAAKGVGTIAQKAAARFLEKQGTGFAERTLAKKVFETALKEGAEGAVIGGRQGITEAYLGDPDAVGENIISNIGIGALTGGAMGASIPVISTGVSKATNTIRDLLPDSKSVISKVFGVEPKVLDDYISLSKSGEKASVPKMEDVAFDVSQKVRGVADDLYEAKSVAKEAKASFSGYEDSLLKESQAKNYEASKNLYKDIQDIESESILQSQAIQQGLDGVKIDARSIISNIKNLASEYKAMGTDSGIKASKDLLKFIERNKSKFGKNADGLEIKRMIMNVDKTINYKGIPMGDFDNVVNLARKDSRYAMDDFLKNSIPEYRDAMRPVAENFELIRNLKGYNTPEKAARRLSGIDKSVRIDNDLPFIKQLESKTGSNSYTKDIDDFINRRNTIEASELAKGLSSAQEALKISQKAKDQLRGITEKSIPSIFKKAASGDKVAMEQVSVISKSFDNPILQDTLNKIGTIEAFDKALSTETGRSLFMSLIGSVIGATAGLGGGIAGFVAGKVAAESTPALAKKAFDQYIAFQSGEFKNLSKIYQISQNTTKKINESLVDFSKKGSFPKAVKYSVINLATGKEASSTDKEAFKENVETIKKYTQAPEMLMDNMTKTFNGLQEVAPNVSQSSQTTATKALSLLQSKLPVENSKLLFSPKYEPSDFDVDNFNKYLRAVNNPYSVIEDMNDGQISIQGVEVLKTVYPKMYQNIVETLTNALTDTDLKMKYNDKIQIATLFEIAVDDTTSLAFLNSMQEIHNSKNAQQPLNRSGNKINVDDEMTATQRITAK